MPTRPVRLFVLAMVLLSAVAVSPAAEAEAVCIVPETNDRETCVGEHEGCTGIWDHRESTPAQGGGTTCIGVHKSGSTRLHA